MEKLVNGEGIYRWADWVKELNFLCVRACTDGRGWYIPECRNSVLKDMGPTVET
jgi:hypothetical protein